MNSSTTSTPSVANSASTPSSSSVGRRGRVVPLIDTAKLLSLGLNGSSQPIMDALLSPTSLAARRSTELRNVMRLPNNGISGPVVVKVDWRAKVQEGLAFRREVDSLADEAEAAFKIGPIVLPDEEIADERDGGPPNPNRIGRMREVRQQSQLRGSSAFSHVSSASDSGALRRSDNERAHDDGDNEDDSDPSTWTDLERAQRELVQRVRFVQPRSIAPSQLQDVIAATSSIAKSVDVDEGRMMLPSERAQKPASLREMIDQRDALVKANEANRPAYEDMMSRSVKLLRQQRLATEERFKHM